MPRRNTYDRNMDNTDYGPEPFVANIHRVTMQNNDFRAALWTGKHLQMALMSIPVGGEIGLEIHPDVDQFLRIEVGYGLVRMGNNRDKLNYQVEVYDGHAVFVPAGTWHNLINTGNRPIKLYSIYSPPHHPHGTVQESPGHEEKAYETKVREAKDREANANEASVHETKAHEAKTYETPEAAEPAEYTQP